MSCQMMTAEDAELENALAFAGDNRQELERVLIHYEADALRYEAAKYLIRNMPGHYSYKDTLMLHRYAEASDSIISAMEGCDKDSIRSAIDSMASVCGIDKAEKVFDSRIVSSEFLIQNIDSAFYAWENGNWAGHITFEEFCETLLPYKIEELQPLDNWRNRLSHTHSEALARLDYCDLYRHSPLAAAKIINQALMDSIRPKADTRGVRHRVLPVETLSRLHMGGCSDYAYIAAAYLRAQGIPVYVEFTPQWAFRDQGHTWNLLPAKDGRNIAFSGVCTQPGQPHKEDERMPKVYRHTYAVNPELMRLNAEGTYVPPLFRNVFMKDVTDRSIMSADITIDVSKDARGTVYLTVFDNKTWVPVAFGTAGKGTARFKAVGVGTLYLPVRYTEKGEMEPIAHPFILGYDSKCRFVRADTGHRQSIRLKRKYPVLYYVYKWLHRLEGGEFQASNDSLFRNRKVAHRIKRNYAEGNEINLPDTFGAYRYWRYISYTKRMYCNMAEMSFYCGNDTTPQRGRVMGSPGSWKDNPQVTKEKVFDGDILTFFDSSDADSAWVGLDLGSPKDIRRFTFYGRGDGNAIEVGDRYELFYWHNNCWNSLGKKVARRPYLTYSNAPVHALFLLRDLTKGKDERIFTYEEGEQVWW